MTIGFVLVRLAAIFLFVYAIQGLPAFSYLLGDSREMVNFGAVALIVSVMLPVGIAAVLWQHPEKVIGAQALRVRQFQRRNFFVFDDDPKSSCDFLNQLSLHRENICGREVELFGP